MRRLGVAIRQARTDSNMTQAELGEALGNVPQTTVSRWELGLVELTVEQVHTIEKALSLRAGTLLITAGYIEGSFDGTDIEVSLMADPRLHPDHRGDVIRFYRSYVELAERRRITDESNSETTGNGP